MVIFRRAFQTSTSVFVIWLLLLRDRDLKKRRTGQSQEGWRSGVLHMHPSLGGMEVKEFFDLLESNQTSVLNEIKELIQENIYSSKF